jgi:aminoglycoside phosphotransferase (APT) family kinase protein
MRDTIYYWKCDRPAALHGVRARPPGEDVALIPQLHDLLTPHFRAPLQLRSGKGHGNHKTYLLEYPQGNAFIRVEDGPEGDGHLEVESRVINVVAAVGVPVPKVLFTDASRLQVPFVVQVIEYIEAPDLNSLHQKGLLELRAIARVIGRSIARWQEVAVAGFGPFQADCIDSLRGYHSDYETYFFLHLDRHLSLLEAHELLSHHETDGIRHCFDRHRPHLRLKQGVLVHKDLALWNIMGAPESIRAFIDWDDAIAGDPLDDLSLLACFHSPEIVQAALEGYAEVRPLPIPFETRFQLHLLRNMIVKAVIRCEAGYFELPAGGSFLMGAEQDGRSLRHFTRERLMSAYEELRQ